MICLSILLLMEISVVYNFRLIQTNAVMNILLHDFWWICGFISGVNLEGYLLGHRAHLWLALLYAVLQF